MIVHENEDLEIVEKRRRERNFGNSNPLAIGMNLSSCKHELTVRGTMINEGVNSRLDHYKTSYQITAGNKLPDTSSIPDHKAMTAKQEVRLSATANRKRQKVKTMVAPQLAKPKYHQSGRSLRIVSLILSREMPNVPGRGGL